MKTEFVRGGDSITKRPDTGTGRHVDTEKSKNLFLLVAASPVPVSASPRSPRPRVSLDPASPCPLLCRLPSAFLCVLRVFVVNSSREHENRSHHIDKSFALRGYDRR